MGVILKENNLIHTKMRHEKFLGSSCYKFDKAKNTIYKKEKLKACVPAENMEGCTIDYEQERMSYFGADSPLCTFSDAAVVLEKQKRKKKTEYTLNKKKVREKCSAFFGLRQSRKFLAFYSISFPMGFPDEAAYQCLNTAFTRFKNECGLKSYLWVAERQKNGTIHFHMLTNTYMYIRKVNHIMARAINTQINGKRNKGKIDIYFDMKKYNGVDVRHVNNNKKALNCYLTKYISKNATAFSRLPYHCSRDISELFTAETFTSVGCSDFRYIRETLRHIQTFVVDNEYCTIEYLCQKQANGKYFNPPDEWYWLRDFCNQQIYQNHHAKTRLNILPLG